MEAPFALWLLGQDKAVELYYRHQERHQTRSQSCKPLSVRNKWKLADGAAPFFVEWRKRDRAGYQQAQLWTSQNKGMHRVVKFMRDPISYEFRRRRKPKRKKCIHRNKKACRSHCQTVCQRIGQEGLGWTLCPGKS